MNETWVTILCEHGMESKLCLKCLEAERDKDRDTEIAKHHERIMGIHQRHQYQLEDEQHRYYLALLDIYGRFNEKAAQIPVEAIQEVLSE